MYIQWRVALSYIFANLWLNKRHLDSRRSCVQSIALSQDTYPVEKFIVHSWEEGGESINNLSTLFWSSCRPCRQKYTLRNIIRKTIFKQGSCFRTLLYTAQLAWERSEQRSKRNTIETAFLFSFFPPEPRIAESCRNPKWPLSLIFSPYNDVIERQCRTLSLRFYNISQDALPTATLFSSADGRAPDWAEVEISEARKVRTRGSVKLWVATWVCSLGGEGHSQGRDVWEVWGWPSLTQEPQTLAFLY